MKATIAVLPGDGIRDALLMVQGPLTVRRHQRLKWAPSLEVGELTHNDVPTPHRVNRWLAAAPQVGSQHAETAQVVDENEIGPVAGAQAADV